MLPGLELLQVLKSVSGDALNIESKIYGRTLEVSNKTNGKLQLSIYSVTGQKVMEDILIADTKFQKQLAHLKGAYILKCVAKDGSTYAKRFIIM